MRQNKAQKDTVGRVMHEFKHGELKRGRGGKVRNPKQAIAIALSEAGASKRQDPKTNRHRLAETKRRERQGRTAQAETEGRQGPTRKELYEQARRKGIEGRSHMSKAELQRALH